MTASFPSAMQLLVVFSYSYYISERFPADNQIVVAAGGPAIAVKGAKCAREGENTARKRKKGGFCDRAGRVPKMVEVKHKMVFFSGLACVKI
jgi:hypothetical protein